MSLLKSPRYENKKLLALANGMACAGCGADDGTIVMAHSNSAIHGKARGMKSHDCFVAALCYRCHGWLDAGTDVYLCNCVWNPTREDKLEFWRRASERTMLLLWQAEKIKVAT